MYRETAPSEAPANVASTLRAVLVAVGGWLVGKGYLTQDAATEIIPVAMMVLPVIWSYFKNHNTKRIVQAAIDAPSGSAR